jgi:hypothetical protein
VRDTRAAGVVGDQRAQGDAPRGATAGLSGRFRAPAQDEQWRRLAHVVLLDVVHSFRLLVARWSALVLTTEESARALQDLAAQAEELSRVFVEFHSGKPASNYVGGEWRKRQLLWSRSFAVAREEALIDKAGERATVGERFRTPGRNLLPLADRRKLEDRDGGRVPPSLRLHDIDSLTGQATISEEQRSRTIDFGGAASSPTQPGPVT